MDADDVFVDSVSDFYSRRNKMAVVEGVIKAVSVKDRNTAGGVKKATSFNINDVWYSGGFKEYTIKKGDEVQMEYVTNAKGFNNITSIVVTKAAEATYVPGSTPPSSGRSSYRQNGQEGGFPIHPLAYERALDRRNALNAAVSCYSAQEVTKEEIIELAKFFEAYTTGDLDREEAEEMLKSEA